MPVAAASAGQRLNHAAWPSCSAHLNALADIAHVNARTPGGNARCIAPNSRSRPRASATAQPQSRVRTWTQRPAANTKTGTADARRQELVVPDLRGHHRPRRHRHLQALQPGRHLHLRSRLHLDGELRVQDHLYRRRRRDPALSRLSDRATRRARRLPGDLLSPALRRAADRRPEGRLRLSRDPPHDGARADEPVLPGFPARRPSDGGDGRLGRRAVGVLSRTPPTSPIRSSA